MRIAIIDEWGILRAGVRTIVRGAGHDVVAESATVSEMLGLLAERPVDLVIIGRSRDIRTIAAIEQVKIRSDVLLVLVLVDTTESAEVLAILGAGAEGIVARSVDETEMLDAIARLGRREHVLGPKLIGVLAGTSAVAATSSELLTDREREVLELVAAGHSNRAIATELSIGESTVKSHLVNVFAKLEVTSRHEAVARGLQLGLLTPTP